MKMSVEVRHVAVAAFLYLALNHNEVVRAGAGELRTRALSTAPRGRSFRRCKLRHARRHQDDLGQTARLERFVDPRDDRWH